MYSIPKNNGKHNPVFNGFPFFDNGLSKGFFNTRGNGLHTVPVNIKETGKSFELEVAAPGMDKKNFKVELTEDRLTISSVQENTEEKTEAGSYTRKEFTCQAFSRSFILPKKLIDKDAITAAYENGILNVRIPKKEEAVVHKNREIQIS